MGTVYNGEKVTLTKPSEAYSSKYAKYQFHDAAEFEPFYNNTLSYNGSEMTVWLESEQTRVSVNDSAELKEIGSFNDYGKIYEVYMDGQYLASFSGDATSASAALSERPIDALNIQPFVGLVFNGYEFKDTSIRSFIDYFGTPTLVSYNLYEATGETTITYEYSITSDNVMNPSFELNDDGSYTISGNIYTISSSIQLWTKDGKIFTTW